ncbi:HET-domain-containing protein, partial [Melanomma pulvis-pyrius CBS 109.77]
MGESEFQTTYNYCTLQGTRYIRLLQVFLKDNHGNKQTPVYRIVHKELPRKDGEPPLDFEAISYTWGDSDRVAGLSIQDEHNKVAGIVGLTKNLSEALPYLSQQSTTGLLWIDQLCIKQADDVEKAIQVRLMGQIYRFAKRVIVWLGPADDSCDIELCKEYLDAVAELIEGVPNVKRMTPGDPAYNPDHRLVYFRSAFNHEKTDAKYAVAIRKFWSRPWFTRGWIVQEILLSRQAMILVGSFQLDMQDLTDLAAIPYAPGNSGSSNSYMVLMNLKNHPFTDDAQPLQFLRLIYQAAQQFDTKEPADRLYSLLGMIDEPGFNFKPDYKIPSKTNFTRFAIALAEYFGSLDFLSLWSANLDEMLPATPTELKGFPSWVPSWTATPLSVPFRLAVGGVKSVRFDIAWNAAKGRRHIHNQYLQGSNIKANEDKLVVRGVIVDYVDTISSARFHRYWDPDNEYLNGLVAQIKGDLPGLEDWTQFEMIDFLNVVSSNGCTPNETTEAVMGLNPTELQKEILEIAQCNEALGNCLSVGRGRRFVRTEKGRLGLAPAIGTKPASRSEGIFVEKGSPIVVIHGCSVPMVLELVDEELREYKVVGDCYVEGIMLGEAV